MKLLSGLFRQAPTAPEPEVLAPDSAAPVPPAAPAVTARIAALDYGADLLGLAGLGSSASTAASPDEQRAAQERVAEFIGQGVVDCEVICQLVIEGPSSRIRQQAAEAVSDPLQLRRLIRDVRGKDKNVYRILKQKCDALLADERQAAQIQSDIAAVCAALERHAHWPYDALYAPTFEHLQERWSALAAYALPQDRQRAEAALTTCAETIAQQLQQAAEQAAREAEIEAAKKQRALEKAAQAEAAAAAAAEAEAARQAQEQSRAEQREAEAQAVRQLGGLIGKALGALKDGATGRALGLRRTIEAKVKAAPLVPPHLVRQLQQLDEKLSLLQDWRNYAVAPKRIQLIEQMEALVGFSEDPAVLAKMIKDLQEEWRTVSKGGVADSEEEWQRFHEAAQAAYQPCKEYFEAQSRLRQENLEKRQALLARLTAFESGHDWAHPDWRLVATALRESKRDWYRHSPIDRAAAKALQESFDAVTARLQERLEAAQAGNVTDKQKLIARAQQLLALDDTEKAVDEARRLQIMWKNTGPVARADDRKLWEEFRQHCDAVYQKRQQQQAKQAAGLDDIHAQAVAICEETESIASLSGAELIEGAKLLPHLRGAFDSLGDLPKAGAHKLRDRIERALDKCQQGLARQRATDEAQSWNNLLEAASRVRAYRLALSENTGEHESLKQSAEEYIAATRHWPRQGLQKIREQLAKTDAGDLAANEAALRMLCIRAEVLTDKPTPAADQGLRREYQVQRLMKTMGQGQGAGPEQIEALILEWAGTGPTPTPVYEELLARFERCRR